MISVDEIKLEIPVISTLSTVIAKLFARTLWHTLQVSKLRQRGTPSRCESSHLCPQTCFTKAKIKKGLNQLCLHSIYLQFYVDKKIIRPQVYDLAFNNVLKVFDLT